MLKGSSGKKLSTLCYSWQPPTKDFLQATDKTETGIQFTYDLYNDVIIYSDHTFDFVYKCVYISQERQYAYNYSITNMKIS